MCDYESTQNPQPGGNPVAGQEPLGNGAYYNKQLDFPISAMGNQGVSTGGHSSGDMLFNVPNPWPEPVDGNALLTVLVPTIKRFIVCSDETALAAALWISATWFGGAVQVAPIAMITAPDKRCGKTQFLTIMERLVCRPLMASNLTPAAVFRIIEKLKPTLLFDEFDTQKGNEDLRGVLNSGHTRAGAFVLRCVGKDHEPTRFSTWGFKALAGIGRPAGTIEDRSIKLVLRRKKKSEIVDQLRNAEPGLLDGLRSKLARFAEDNQKAVSLSRPEIPAALNDRAADNWYPLLAIADIAGGDWPKKARKTAMIISGADTDTDSIGNELLTDIREVFYKKSITDRISLKKLLEYLCEDDERRWKTFNRGNSMTTRQLSDQLSEYGIKSKQMRYNDSSCGNSDGDKGYEVKWFDDTFSRYLLPYIVISETQKQNDINPLFANSYDVSMQNAVSETNTISETNAVSDMDNVSETANSSETLHLQILQQIDEIVSMFPKNQDVKESINGNGEITEDNE